MGEIVVDDELVVLEREGGSSLASAGEIGKEAEWDTGRMSSLRVDGREGVERIDWASRGMLRSIKSGSSMSWLARKASFWSIGSLLGDMFIGVTEALVLPDIF